MKKRLFLLVYLSLTTFFIYASDNETAAREYTKPKLLLIALANTYQYQCARNGNDYYFYGKEINILWGSSPPGDTFPSLWLVLFTHYELLTPV
jgi:hypothetical protein